VREAHAQVETFSAPAIAELVGPPIGPAIETVARTYALKRSLDVGMALIGLALTLPILAIIALAIKLSDGGPVIYSQVRWGRGGRTFRLFKFRTMVADSDEAFGIRQAAVLDERVTGLGRVLRAMGLDELPQLVNVLRGNMSVVGPRALAQSELVVDGSGRLVTYETVPGFAQRLSVTPGITSPATIYMDKDVDPITKFAYDVRYVQEQSLWLDLKLVALSMWISLRGKWETRDKKL
jgi:lipopolysaccharide/colanic/teichoic acid biosynthesis glycosyltransferase